MSSKRSAALQARAPASAKRRRGYDEEDDGSSDSSELSDEELSEASDSDTPDGEVEESYVSEDEQDLSDEDSEMPTPAPKPAPTVSRGIAKSTVRKRVPAKPVAVPKKAAPKKGNTSNSTPNKSAPTIKLKIGKDRLREVTSNWTPPPGADTGASSTAAATNATNYAAKPASTLRGRKVVEESEEDEDEDEDAEGEEDDEQEEPDDDLNDEDAEGETDDELMDSDMDTGNTPGTDFMSRTGTPDMSRLTNRQRTRLGDITTADLLELPSGYEKPGANKGATLSVQEQELKRAEMARRRKNLTDQKLEEEKIDTINRLLKKQTPKMRGRGRATGDATPADGQTDTAMGDTEPPPPPTMVRWISNKDGIRLAIPETWMTAPIGRNFEAQHETESMRNVQRKLVEEL